MSVINQFNGLGGATVSRQDLEAVRTKAIQEENEEIVFRITALLDKFPKIQNFELEEHDCMVVEPVPKGFLYGLDFEPSQDELHGLGKSVSPSEVYDMITAKIIKMIEVANANDYKRKWTAKEYGTGYTIPFNFVTKKRYRGVNVLMLTELEPLENPFFLTFKQIKDLKGKVKKGAKGFEVVYFTRIYKTEDRQKDVRFSSYDKKKVETFATENGIEKELGVIPMLKYYHVYNGKDIEGIDFGLDKFKLGFIENESPVTEVKTLPIPEAIIKNYPAPQPTLKFGGDRAFYSPGKDHVQMPHLADFETVQDYYRTLLHEFSHSTGSSKRLARDFSGSFGSKKYAFEELVAELGAIFLSAEAGIIWHNNKNHAAYLKSWNSVLAQIKEDNKFIMKASTAAQKVADFVLQFDEKGDPLYFKDLEKELNKSIEKAVKNPVPKATSKVKIEYELYTYDLILKLKNEIVNKLDLSKEGRKAKNFINELSKKAHNNIEIRTELGDWMTGKTKTIGLLKLLENVKYSDKKLIEFNAFAMLDSIPKKAVKNPVAKVLKKTKEKGLEPNGFANKPKSVSIQTAIKDVLTLPKFKKEKPLISSIIYKHYSEAQTEDATRQGEFSKFDLKIIENTATLLYDYDFDYITQFGVEFVKSVNNRLESLRNQKNNLALFDGLKAPVSKNKKPKTVINTIKKGEELQYLDNKTKVASINKFGVVTWHKKGLTAATRNRIRKDAVVVGLAAPMFVEAPKEDPVPGPEQIYNPKPIMPIVENIPVENVFTDENEESITLGSPVVEVQKEEKVNLPLNRNSLAYRRQNRSNATHDYYEIENPDVSEFLGQIEKKKKESVAITIAGGQGSGKTSFVFQLMNAFAKNYKVGHASIEEHPESALYENKAERFWNENAKATIDSPEINSLEDIHDLIMRNDVIVIDSFSKLLSMNNKITLDETFRKKYDGKLFVIIYQLTTDGKMRGGSSSQFDGDIILFVEKFPDFADNYVYADKNRYQDRSLDELHYNIATAKLMQPEPGEKELVFTEEIERI